MTAVKLFDVFKYKTSMNKVFHKVVRFLKEQWNSTIHFFNQTFTCSFDKQRAYIKLESQPP